MHKHLKYSMEPHEWRQIREELGPEYRVERIRLSCYGEFDNIIFRGDNMIGFTKESSRIDGDPARVNLVTGDSMLERHIEKIFEGELDEQVYLWPHGTPSVVDKKA
jgi:hypothetical protein